MIKAATQTTSGRTLARIASSTLQKGRQRTFATAAIASNAAIEQTAAFQVRRYAPLGAAIVGLGLAQYQLGNSDDFFEHKFSTSKAPCDLADFYGTEDFMEVFCVFPFMVNFMMRQAHFDDDGNIHAWGIAGPGQLKVTIEFDEKEEDTTGDGEPDTITYFNKREQFRDVASWLPFGGATLWEMTQNFGYRMKDDGTCEVYHHGEHFSGFFPMRFLFQMHARYVIWATQRFINSEDFGSEDRSAEAEEFRQNIPLHEFQLFLNGLTKQVETAIQTTDAKKDEKKAQQLQATLQRLNTVSAMDHSKMKPQLLTLRSHKTHISSVHLMVDDEETKDTIQTAMEQIGSTADREEPVRAMRALSRRTTLATMKPTK